MRSPGGKATHASGSAGRRGLLVANDIDRGRAEVLRHNLERLGARNALVLSELPQRLAKRWPGAFDRVIVDAPCSGEGMFRKKEEARFHWSEAHVAGCAIRQQDILNSAAALLRPADGWSTPPAPSRQRKTKDLSGVFCKVIPTSS